MADLPRGTVTFLFTDIGGAPRSGSGTGATWPMPLTATSTSRWLRAVFGSKVPRSQYKL
jgi:hypothetical protein